MKTPTLAEITEMHRNSQGWLCLCCKQPDLEGPENGSGGLCEACNEGDCPSCGSPDDDWN